MLEVGLVCIIALAVGYWVTLWLMGRRDDVLHGDFVHEEAGSKAEATLAEPFPPPAFPKKPTIVGPAIAVRDRMASAATGSAFADGPRASPQTTRQVSSDQWDTLNRLLASIKRDLKDASQL